MEEFELHDLSERLQAVEPQWVIEELRKRGVDAHIKPRTSYTVAEWQKMYDDAGSVNELARTLGMARHKAQYQLDKNGITIRSSGFKSPRSEAFYGEGSPTWKGGTFYHSDGYIYQLAPGHPAAKSAKGYVLQHRLVMEDKLGRFLTPTEMVHHVNEVKDDNRPENLELFNRSTHMQHHKSDAERDERGRFAS